MVDNNKIHIFDYNIASEIVAETFDLNMGEFCIANIQTVGGGEVLSIAVNMDDLGFRFTINSILFEEKYRMLVIKEIIK